MKKLDECVRLLLVALVVQMQDFNKRAASTPDTADVCIVRIKMCGFFVWMFG
jgi:hypothetical protein